ncbi:MAG: adenylate/guanylate cyclase domain-containing protein [Alkalispirochaeta sp.]|jgi:class 3 adenylate cyclase
MPVIDDRILRVVKTDGLGARIKDVLIDCYDQIVAGAITTVDELVVYLEPLGDTERLEGVVRRCYRLIREIHWGIFRHLDSKTHPELWRALTVTNRKIADIADLKQNVVVPNIYCALLDVHGYTAFCQKNRHNVTMLRMLDNLMHNDLQTVAAHHHCIASRSAGDMVILIGSSPIDIVRACLGIIASFSRKRVVKATETFESRRGASVVMQDFNVSAGIAGGQHYNSLIVTQDGDISGVLVNTAARLQSLAGRIAPDRSKVMVASHVYTRYRKAANLAGGIDGLQFFDCGKIAFKGVGVGVHELLFLEWELKKVAYQDEYQAVVSAARRGQWSDSLVPDAIRLVAKAIETNPIPQVSVIEDGRTRKVSSSEIAQLCKEAINIYEYGKDHRKAAVLLEEIGGLLERCTAFDPLVLIHFRRIAGAYDQMVRELERVQYQRIIENQKSLFSVKERSLIDHAARLEGVRAHLIEREMQDNSIYSTTMLWNKIVNDFDNGLEIDVYLGKR